MEHEEQYRLNTEEHPKLLTDTQSWKYSKTASFIHLFNRKKTLS